MLSELAVFLVYTGRLGGEEERVQSSLAGRNIETMDLGISSIKINVTNIIDYLNPWLYIYIYYSTHFILYFHFRIPSFQGTLDGDVFVSHAYVFNSVPTTSVPNCVERIQKIPYCVLFIGSIDDDIACLTGWWNIRRRLLDTESTKDITNA